MEIACADEAPDIMHTFFGVVGAYLGIHPGLRLRRGWCPPAIANLKCCTPLLNVAQSFFFVYHKHVVLMCCTNPSYLAEIF